jgi:DNA topoisomerase-3
LSRIPAIDHFFTLCYEGFEHIELSHLIATDTGMHLIDTIKSDLLKSPELTGQWEHKLRQMERGLYDPKQFKAELFQMVLELTDEVIFGN